MHRLMNGRKLRLLIQSCYMTKAVRMREKVCNILAPENVILCQKVAEMTQSVRLALRLDLEPVPIPVPRLLVPRKHYYDLMYVCDNVNQTQKQTYLLRATATCVLEIDAWPQQLQIKAPT